MTPPLTSSLNIEAKKFMRTVCFRGNFVQSDLQMYTMSARFVTETHVIHR